MLIPTAEEFLCNNTTWYSKEKNLIQVKSDQKKMQNNLKHTKVRLHLLFNTGVFRIAFSWCLRWLAQET